MHPLGLGRGEGEGHPQMLRDGPWLGTEGECREGKRGKHPLTKRARQTQGRETQEKRRKGGGRTTETGSGKGDGLRQTKINLTQNEKGTPKQTKSGDWSEE